MGGVPGRLRVERVYCLADDALVLTWLCCLHLVIWWNWPDWCSCENGKTACL